MLTYNLKTYNMGKTVKPLNDTLIKSSKPKEDDYTLSDGNGLYLLINKLIRRYYLHV